MTATTAPCPAWCRVLNIPELPEAILLALDNGTLLLCQSVCRIWRDAIVGSIGIQRKLFLRPATLEQMKELRMLNPNSILIAHTNETQYSILNPLLGDHEYPNTIKLDPSHAADWPACVLPGQGMHEYIRSNITLTPLINRPPPKRKRIMPMLGPKRRRGRITPSINRMALTQPQLPNIAALDALTRPRPVAVFGGLPRNLRYDRFQLFLSHEDLRPDDDDGKEDYDEAIKIRQALMAFDSTRGTVEGLRVGNLVATVRKAIHADERYDEWAGGYMMVEVLRVRDKVFEKKVDGTQAMGRVERVERLRELARMKFKS